MRDLLSLPSASEDDAIVNLADWVEMTAILSADRNSSREDLKRAIRRSSGLSDDHVEQLSSDVFTEIEDRLKSCGNSTTGQPLYPFMLDSSSTLLTSRFMGVTDRSALYIFMLAITRGDMSSQHRTLNGVDPTKLFELLCASVLRNFWGGESSHSGSLVFGTARPSSVTGRKFRNSIEELCEKLGEGNGWKEGAPSTGGGDGKLDVVVWRKFSDGRQGALTGFAQCKTGVNWEEHLTKLQPETFVDTFMVSPLALTPLRIYMVPARVTRANWRRHTKDAELLLDRCRITQYSEPLAASIKPNCRLWLSAAFGTQSQAMKRVSGR